MKNPEKTGARKRVCFYLRACAGPVAALSSSICLMSLYVYDIINIKNVNNKINKDVNNNIASHMNTIHIYIHIIMMVLHNPVDCIKTALYNSR